MPEFEVEINVGHEDLAQLCSMYWTTAEDGSFSYTVKTLGEMFEEAPHRISKIVGQACFARSASKRCSRCDKGFAYRSRAEWTSNARHAPSLCPECLDAEQRQLAERREQAAAAMRTAILARFTIASDGATPRAEDLDISAAFGLAALLEDAEEVSRGIIIPVDSRTDRFTPTSDYDIKLLSLLADLGLVRLHPSSPPSSFVWEEDGTLRGEYYPTRTSYYLRGAGDLAVRVDEYLMSFAQRVTREKWPDRWADQFYEFWLDVAVSECKAYLVHMLNLHSLDFSPGQKTDDVLRRALKWFSIGQVYYFIWRAARDSAAYRARERIPARQAANSAVTRISADVDRAYAQGWEVSVYQRDTRLPPSTLSHILFSRSLKLDDPMAYAPVDLPVRRPGLELAWEKIDSAEFERLLFQLVVETEGYENVDWLMHTNAPDRGRDVSAVRLRNDPLSGHSSQRVAIQCKHWLTCSVRDSDVSSAIVSIGHWQDPPFDVLVFATSGRFTSDAVALIERHNSRGERPTVEVWNDAHLEFLLSERPHLIRAFQLR